jgi:hypothetical protein
MESHTAAEQAYTDENEIVCQDPVALVDFLNNIEAFPKVQFWGRLNIQFYIGRIRRTRRTGLYACIFCPTTQNGQKDTASIPCAASRPARSPFGARFYFVSNSFNTASL